MFGAACESAGPITPPAPPPGAWSDTPGGCLSRAAKSKSRAGVLLARLGLLHRADAAVSAGSALQNTGRPTTAWDYLATLLPGCSDRDGDETPAPLRGLVQYPRGGAGLLSVRRR